MTDPFAPEPYPICPHCGSDLVLADAWAIWNQSANCWELHSTFDAGYCPTCESDLRHVWGKTSADVPEPAKATAP